ncbi:MAG: OpgC domain-containing protein [Terriglobales bacterium]
MPRAPPEGLASPATDRAALVPFFQKKSIAVMEPTKSAVVDAWSCAVRDPRIDTLRGIFLVLMTVDHLPNHPLLRFTFQSFGFVSAAEGFVFVSGLVSGAVYGRILAKQGEANLRRRAWHRARDIYLTHVLLYTFALLGGLWGGLQIASRLPGLWTGWWHGALLISQPPLFGILPMYAVFLLLTPLLLEQMARGRALPIGAASMALWLAAQWGIGTPAHNPPWLQLGFFNILAWQLLFVAGAFFGHRKAAGRGSPIPASRLLLVFSLVLAAMLFLVRHRLLFAGNLMRVDIPTALGAWRSINHPLRLINFAAFAYIVWYAPRSIDKKLHGLSAFRFLRYLGQHSLQVFAWSTLVTYTAFSCRGSWASLPPVWRALLVVTAALSLAIPAWLHQRWRLQKDKISLTTAQADVPAEARFAAVIPNDIS